MPKIRLGIDAKWYFEGPPSGRVVVENLVNEFVKSHNRFDLFLFVGKNHKDLAEEIFYNKATIIPIKSKPNLLSNIYVIPREAKRFDLDIVLFQNFISYSKSNWKKVAYIHDFLFLDFPQYYSKKELLYFKPMRYLAKRSDAIITISESEKKRILNHKILKENKVFVVHHGLSSQFKPLAAYSPEVVNDIRKRYQLPDQFLLYVGRINIRKNLLNLIKSLKAINSAGIHLVIVGEEEHKNIDITSYIKDNDLQDKIIYTGYVPEEDLYIIYAMATIFCFPSYAEGFGLPPLEAMKCGIPAVVSNRTSLPEVCGEAGIYIDPDNPNDIAEKINRLLADPAFYALKAQQSIQQAGRYNWTTAANAILEIIELVYDN